MTSKKIKINIIHIVDLLRLVSPIYYILGAFLVFFALIVAIFWPRTVELSYSASKTCFYQPTLAPGLLRSKGDDYRLEAEKVLSVGRIPIFALNMCAIPLKTPKEGQERSHLLLAGLPIQKTYVISAKKPPQISKSAEVRNDISLSKPFKIKLSSPDFVHQYNLVVGGKRTQCSTESTFLVCDLTTLALKQGATYTFDVERLFNNVKVGTVASYPVSVLDAVSVVDSTIHQGETVFSRPTGLELMTNKSIKKAKFRLFKIMESKKEEIPIASVSMDKKIAINWKGELARQASFELISEKVIAADDSHIDGVYKLSFGLSGGPKVTNVNVGTYKVPLGSTMTLTFDQPLLESQDISKTISVTGGARVTGVSAHKVMISLKDVSRCTDVQVKITDALTSSYGITGGSTWSYATRTICQEVRSIGASAMGRAINAYIFGSGSNAVVFTGAIHGNERSTQTLMLRWIDDLEVNARSIPSGKKVIVIPALNPDGIAKGTRVNVNNVDLNRNFATSDWKSDITTTSNAPFPGGGGKSALSEPESQAIANYIANLRPQLVLSYHSVGGLLAANQAGASRSWAGTYASLSGYRNATGSSDTFEYGISGTADDYYGQVLGVSSVLIELGSHSDAQFNRNQKAMWAMIK